MAGDDDGDGVDMECLSDGSGGVWAPHSFCQFAVGDGRSVGDALKFLPDGELERRSVESEREIEIGKRSIEVLVQLVEDTSDQGRSG